MKNGMWGNGVMLALLFVCFTYIAGFAYAEPLTVAVLGFESKEQAINDFTLGTKIADLLTYGLTEELAIDPNISVVNRDKLNEIIDEMSSGITGIGDESQQIKIGQLAGANILVTGRAFTIDNKELVMIAKIIGTETSKVKVVVEKVDLYKDVGTGPKIEELSKKVAVVILGDGQSMVAKATKKEEDKIQELKDKIGNKELPKVLVVIKETHVGGGIIDPAAETEFAYILDQCDFPVASKGGLDLSSWASSYIKNTKLDIDPGIDADIIIVGEAFSEYGTTTGGKLFSCTARVEIQAIDRNTRETLAVDKEKYVAVELSEQIAAKTAIEKATANIAYRIIPRFVEKWNSKK